MRRDAPVNNHHVVVAILIHVPQMAIERARDVVHARLSQRVDRDTLLGRRRPSTIAALRAKHVV